MRAGKETRTACTILLLFQFVSLWAPSVAVAVAVTGVTHTSEFDCHFARHSYANTDTAAGTASHSFKTEIFPYTDLFQPPLAILYLADSPRPWNKVRDELRILDDSWLLGLTGADLPGLRGLPFPFLLARP